MLKKILIGLAIVVAIFVVVVALQPAQFRVERSATIAAAPAAVFPHVNDLRKTVAWSPWLKLDPAAKVSYEGPAAGVGAAQSWDGNSQVGAGKQTIVESNPNELVRIRLDFKKPFESTATTDFTLKPQAGQTVITWAIYGENNFISKALCLFMSQDKMIGGAFDQGLASLKAIVEQPVARAAQK